MQAKNKTRARLLLLLSLFCTLCTSLGRVYAAASPEGGGSGEKPKDSLNGEIFWKIVQEKPLTLLKVLDEEGAEKHVLLVGNTGGGKSTTVNYFLRHTMVGEEVDFEIQVCVERADRARGPEIGHGAVACTDCCAAYAGGDFCYIDTPGFGDTRGREQKVYNQLAMHSFIKENGGVDFVLIVVAYPEFQATRGDAFIDLLKNLSPMMYDLDGTCIPNIFCGVTKLPVAGATCDELANNLEEYFRNRITGEPEQDRDGRFFDAGGIMTGIFESGRLFPIYPLDGGASREALLGAMRESSADPIPADRFKLGLTGMDIQSLSLEAFQQHPAVRSLPEFLSELKKLKENAKALLKKVKEIEGIAKGSEEASKEYRNYLKDLRIQKEGEIADIDARIRDLGDLEEVVRYITIDSDPRSNGGYFFSATMMATYGGIPFSREDSQVIDDGCTYEEVICDPAHGIWVVRFTTPEPEAGKMLKAGGRAAATAAATAVTTTTVVAEAEAAAAAAGAVGAAAAGAAAGAAAATAVASICALQDGKQEYSPKLEIWCKKRDIHADLLTTLGQERQAIASRIEELRKERQEAFESQAREAGERREKAEAKAEELLATIEASYGDLKEAMEHIATHYNVLTFIAQVLPLMDDPDRMKVYTSVSQCVANYQGYRALQEQKGGIFAQVDGDLREVARLESSPCASLRERVARFLREHYRCAVKPCQFTAGI